MSIIGIERLNEFAVVTLNRPPVNALNQEMRQRLCDAVAELEADSDVHAVILISAGKTFIAGADVGEFERPLQPPHLPDVVQLIENASKPWVAAIHGSALGGGFEIAMGCRFRVALDSASIGLPEVTLGLVPGAGGTVRTPRLAGFDAAVELVTTGKPCSAPLALQKGLVDAVFEDDLLACAVRFIRDALAQTLPPSVSTRPVVTPDRTFWVDRSVAIAKRARGEAARLRALECIQRASELPLDEAFAFERSAFLELRESSQAKALRSVFFAERAALRPSNLRDVAPLPLHHIGVIGGGTMGAGIAAALLDAGLRITLIERDEPALTRGIASVKGILNSSVERGKLSDAEALSRLAAMQGSTDYRALSDADMVIEAVFEDIDIKRGVFADIGRICRPNAVLATNTSYIDPRQIADRIPNLSRFIGLHFFSPANVMKLLEIVPIPETSSEVLATGFSLARSLGKIPVQAGICEGFIGNRILKRYRAAAERLVMRGIDIAEIDRAMRLYGFAMGPFEAQDMGGLDIAFMQRERARTEGHSVPETLGDILVRAGRKGRKSHGGWYDYVQGDGTPHTSAAVAALITPQLRPNPGVDRATIATNLVAEMADEGRKILAEGIARSAGDIDLVKIHGYGFPRWRGGPMFQNRLDHDRPRSV